MSRYIDANKIRYMWQYNDDGTHHDGVTLESIIDRIPTADVVEVVRCKDCKHCDCVRIENFITFQFNYDPTVDNTVKKYFCQYPGQKNTSRYPSDYCSYGERREK